MAYADVVTAMNIMSPDAVFQAVIIITFAMAKVMFSSLSIALSVCLSVCLLATLRKNGRTDFHEIFMVAGT